MRGKARKKQKIGYNAEKTDLRLSTQEDTQINYKEPQSLLHCTGGPAQAKYSTCHLVPDPHCLAFQMEKGILSLSLPI